MAPYVEPGGEKWFLRGSQIDMLWARTAVEMATAKAIVSIVDGLRRFPEETSADLVSQMAW